MKRTSESILGTEFHSCIFTRNGQLQMPFLMFSENTHCNERKRMELKINESH